MTFLNPDHTEEHEDSGGGVRENELRRRIEEYYLPKQLIDAILENGEIPESSTEAQIGIGFIDIADYTYLSKFLSPKENQTVLNGLYTAFHSVLQRHGGYLNKIEGDSLMFHYGGLIDPKTKNMSTDEEVRYIARELFYTCVEMQRVCVLFNQANDKFLYESATRETREALQRAFDIISSLRTNLELASSINALFQIRIRIGANIGTVTIGNFGPHGAKQWDVIGLPVIDAKRMETTAPIGGLRISEQFYEILEETGIADAYYGRFKREAEALFGYYRDITKEDLFKFSTVVLKDKKSVRFKTYSIQVNPGLPEAIMEQVELLLEKGSQGADLILEFLQYYRGNRYVTAAIEAVFHRSGVVLRKWYLLKLMYPKKYREILRHYEGDHRKSAAHIDNHYSLFDLFEILGRYQDFVKKDPVVDGPAVEYHDYEQFMHQEQKRVESAFDARRQSMFQRAHFYNVVYPLVFTSVRTSIIEYQSVAVEAEAV